MLACVIAMHAKMRSLIYYKTSLADLKPEKEKQEMYKIIYKLKPCVTYCI